MKWIGFIKGLIYRNQIIICHDLFHYKTCSIIKKLLILPNETIVYPGHGKPTRIGDEKPIYLESKPNID